MTTSIVRNCSNHEKRDERLGEKHVLGQFVLMTSNGTSELRTYIQLSSNETAVVPIKWKMRHFPYLNDLLGLVSQITSSETMLPFPKLKLKTLPK